LNDFGLGPVDVAPQSLTLDVTAICAIVAADG
jgi:hypothetical protein